MHQPDCQMCLHYTKNVAYARLLGQIIRLPSQFHDYQIRKKILDNACEFTSQAFDDYCMIIGIDVEHLVACTHT